MFLTVVERVHRTGLRAGSPTGPHGVRLRRQGRRSERAQSPRMASVPPAAVSLPPHARSAGDARRLVRRTLISWGCPPAVRETAELLVSELVANAVRHARTGIRLTLRAQGGAVRAEVSDGSPHRPRPRLPETHSESGRGLFLVDQLAPEWGVREHAGGKTVWFLLGQVSRAVPAG